LLYQRTYLTNMSHSSYCSPAFIDRISLTIPIPGAYWNEATNNIFQLSDMHGGFRPRQGGIESMKFQIYRFAWNVRVDPTLDSYIYLQAFPTKSSVGFMRLDWNPVSCGSGAFARIVGLLLPCIPMLYECIPMLSVTRLDITVDVLGLRIDQIYAFSNSAKSSYEAHFDGKQSALSGFYVGAKKSQRRILVYDRNLRQHGGNSKIINYPSGARSKRLLRPCTRVEFRINNLGTLSFAKSAESQIGGFFLADARALETHRTDRIARGFSAICRRYGAQEALSFYSPRTRATLRQHLRTYCSFPWLDHMRIWRQGMLQLETELAIATH
jgi:hypothetical protein